MNTLHDLHSLAKRIEAANAQALAEHGVVAARLFPEIGAVSLPVAGGVASFVGTDVPVSYAVGLGMDGPVADSDVARVAEFYRSRGMMPRIDVCPLADNSLLAAMRAHGFGLHWFVNVLARQLTANDDCGDIPNGITVRETSPDDDEFWTTVVDAGFSEGQPLTEGRRKLGMMLFHRPGARTYFAEVNGKLAGAGLLAMHNGYAALAATSTLPEFRGRGVHAALIRRRLAEARNLGCDLAGFFAAPGSTSQRNAERHAFRLLYSKAAMKADN